MLGKMSLFERRKLRIRSKLKKINDGKLRLTVHRTNKHIYAQVVDDVKGQTVVSSSTMEKDVRAQLPNGGNKQAAKAVGESVAKRLLASGIKEVVFDRSGHLYHGRVKELADAAREFGLVF